MSKFLEKAFLSKLKQDYPFGTELSMHYNEMFRSPYSIFAKLDLENKYPIYFAHSDKDFSSAFETLENDIREQVVNFSEHVLNNNCCDEEFQDFLDEIIQSKYLFIGRTLNQQHSNILDYIEEKINEGLSRPFIYKTALEKVG